MIRLIICAGLGIAGAATCVVAHSHNKREREEYERKNEEYLEALKENVIQQNYIDALKSIGKNGNLVVVPENSTPLVDVK